MWEGWNASVAEAVDMQTCQDARTLQSERASAGLLPRRDLSLDDFQSKQIADTHHISSCDLSACGIRIILAL